MTEIKPTKYFTPNAVAGSHTAIALCVAEFLRSSDTHNTQTLEAFRECLDEKFRVVFALEEWNREDEHDLHRIWDALRRTLSSQSLNSVFDGW